MARSDYGVNFNGRRIVHPGAYDAIDADSMTLVSSGSLNLPIVVGTADAGEAGVVKFFSGTDEAASYLRGGDLLKAVQIMFSPSSEGGGGASLIGVVVTNVAVAATTTLGALQFTSKERGEGGNRIQVKLENGQTPGTKKLTVTRWDLNVTEVYDNVGAVMSLDYTGTAPYASVTVSGSSLKTKVGADASSAAVDLDIDLTNDRFNTMQKLVEYISTLSGYSAKLENTNAGDIDSAKLDSVAAVSINTSTTLLAVKADIAHTVTTDSNLVSLTVTDDTSISNFDYSYLANGSKGTSPSSWVPYFGAIKKQFSDMLVVLTSDLSIQAEALAHVGEMEKRFQKQVLFTGGAVGESVEQIKQRAAALNSSRAVVGYPGIYHSVGDSGKTVLPSYFTGAMLAGRVAGVDASEPITFDYFNVLGLEHDLLAGDPDVDDLITSGVATLERVNGGGFRLVQGITTYLGTNNVLYREISVRRGADNLSSSMRKTLEDTFVGKKGLKATPSAVQTKAVEVLEKAMMEGTITSYKNIVVRMVGTAVYVDYQVAPVEPINFVLVTTHFVAEQ